MACKSAPVQNTPFAFRSGSPDETKRLGGLLGKAATPGSVIALTGELGAGKTVLVKGAAEALGVDPRQVTSPTFVLVNEYRGPMPIYHFDAYRLQGAADLIAIGCEEMFFGEGVSLIEWADRVAECLPDERLDVALQHAGETTRDIRLCARGNRYQTVIESVKAQWHER